MKRQSVDWDERFHALEAFKEKHGHCQVPTEWEKDPRIGRWVAVQRYRHKLGELQKHFVDRLDQIGFVWNPTDRGWNDMFLRLVKYKGKHGDCNVPTSFPADLELAFWVATQRQRKKKGALSAERAHMLDELGFAWSMYRWSQAEKSVGAGMSSLDKTDESVPEEHLYQVSGAYIQYNGTGPRPAKLEKYIQLHNGELPPCIILPRRPQVFRVGSSDTSPAFVRTIKWPGKGLLPEEVLEYLNENGALPPHS